MESILVLIAINTLLALSLYIPLSAGLFALSVPAFAAMGAYSSAILTVMFGWSLPAALVATLPIVALAGVIGGLPALRLRGIYLGILTVGFTEVVRFLLGEWQWIGGAIGMRGMVGTTLGLAYVVVAVAFLIVWVIDRSRIGWALRAIGQNDLVASCIGLNVTAYKLGAFALHAMLAATAGGLFAHYMFFIEPDMFNFHFALLVMLQVVLGGVETMWGALIGPVILTILPEWLRWLQEWRLVFYGALFILLMAIRPQGLLTRRHTMIITRWVQQLFSGRRPAAGRVKESEL